MAVEELNEKDRRKLTQIEIHALADRMLARAVSALFETQPALRHDMVLSVPLLRMVATTWPDGVEVMVWRVEG
jgi:hypothetical protein